MNEKEPTSDAMRDRRALTPQKREALRQVIIELFSGALFQDVGMREICARAGVTPRTVYKHFGSKDELLMAAIEPDMARLSAAMTAAARREGGLEARAKAVLRAYAGFYHDNPAIARIVFLNIPSAQFVSNPGFVQVAQIDAVRALIEEGRAQGMVRKDAPAEELVQAVAAIAMRAMFRSLAADGANWDPEDLSDRVWAVARPLLFIVSRDAVDDNAREARMMSEDSRS